MTTTLRLDPAGTGPTDIAIDTLVLAGWSGRNQDAVAHHIEELAALGVAPPSRTPLFYRVGTDRLTTAPAIQVVGTETSGEAEAVLIATGQALYVGLGSDHTDRAAEAHSVALSKQLCPKPLGPALWPYAAVAAHWDALQLTSWIWDGEARILYQDGTLAELLPPDALFADHGPLRPGMAMFCGTLPAIGGVRPATRFECQLRDPVLGRSLTHRYTTHVLPSVA